MQRGALFRFSLAFLLISSTALGEQTFPIGGEFQVNTYTDRGQYFPAVASDPEGNFVVVWQSFGSSGTDSSNFSIQGQRYDSDGSPIGGEFQVNTYTSNRQEFASVAVDGAGAFVVVWASSGSSGTDNSSYSVQGQRYDSDGSPSGSQFQVNTYTTGRQNFPTVATNLDGFVVVWQNRHSVTDSSGYDIQGQRYDSDGFAIGGEFLVNTYTTSHQQRSSVAMEADGSLAVVWESFGSSGTDASEYSVQGQLYDSDGSPSGGEFQVNTYTTDDQRFPSVAIDTAGDFVVVFQSIGSDGTDSAGSGIQGRRYSSDGMAIGGEFQVNTYTTSFQTAPAVATDPVGRFVVVWGSLGSSGTDFSVSSVQGQRYDSDGAAIGGEFQVNTYINLDQYLPAVATDARGTFVVVWDSIGSAGTDISGSSIQGQRYEAPIFTDGFESGDTSAWSSTVQ
ncbi:MAG: hypothetical protein WBO69_06015 [Thermoanaerobaculia bacterium]